MIIRTASIIFRPFTQNPFARGAGVLAGGNAGAQLLTVIAAPLITRLYSPEDFGLFAVYSSFLAMISVISSLRYELAIPLPKEEHVATNLVALCLLSLGAVTLATSLILVVFGKTITEAIHLPELTSYLWLLPFGVLLGGAYNIFNYWTIRARQFGAIASTRLNQVLGTIALQIGAFQLGSLSLILASVIGQSIGTIKLARRSVTAETIQQLSWFQIKDAAKQYHKFPKFTLWAGLLSSIASHLSKIVVAAFFGATQAGTLFVAEYLLAKPTAMIINSINKTHYSYARTLDQANLRKLTSDLHRFLVCTALPFIILIFVAAPETMGYILGNKWVAVGSVVGWISFYVYMQIAASSYQIFNITQRQGLGLVIQILMSSIKFAGIFTGILSGDFATFIIYYTTASFFAYTLVLFAKFAVIGITAKETIFMHLEAVLSALICSIPLIYFVFGKMNTLGLFLSIILAASLGLCNFFIRFKIFSRETRELA